MAEAEQSFSPMELLPPEILLKILRYLPAKDLIKAREVTSNWKLLIDDLCNNDNFWLGMCRNDYNTIFLAARKKAYPGLSNFNLYRSLKLWSKLSQSTEDHNEFAFAAVPNHEIYNFQMLSNGVIGVHRSDSIVYYNIETLAIFPRLPIVGKFSKYSETDKTIVTLSFDCKLSITRKLKQSYKQEKKIENVRLYLLTDEQIYYVKKHDEIYVIDLYIKDVTERFLAKAEDGVMALSFTNGILNVLTCQPKIFQLIHNRLVLKFTSSPSVNLLDQISKYNFLEYFDWRLYDQWTHLLRHGIPNGSFKDIVTMRLYGETCLVGTTWGDLVIYKAYNSAGELDISRSRPLKQYNFMEIDESGLLYLCPVIQIDIVERYYGHSVLVGMPQKIIVLNFAHNFYTVSSVELMPVTVVSYSISDPKMVAALPCFHRHTKILLGAGPFTSRALLEGFNNTPALLSARAVLEDFAPNMEDPRMTFPFNFLS